jgi:UDP-N-acetylmuramoyl-tripeptide--D-alanyl-D-alanine ligase
MKAAIENFAHIEATKKVIFIGGMMELGSESISEHQALVNLIDKYNWQHVILVGGDFGKVHHPFIYFNTSSEAKEWFAQQNFEDTHLLIKGSRSMQMEKVLQ